MGGVLALLKFAFVMVPVFVITSIVGVLTIKLRFNRRIKLFRNVGRNYGARIDSKILMPLMRFMYLGNGVEVRDMRRGPLRRRSTILKTRIAEPATNVFVLDRLVASEMRPPRNSQIMLVNDENFDREFIVRAKDSKALQRILTESCCWQLRELRNRFSQHLIWFNLEGKRLSIGVSGVLYQEIDLQDFVRMALKVVDQINLSGAKGIEFDDVGSATLISDAHCPVCSGELSTHVVICLSCKTPHCRECWEYNGRCAMFACNETRCH